MGLVTSICDLKQGYTQFGGLRPFGVSFLIAGYDASHNFQLYHTDPSGNFSGWKAYAIGVNNNTAQQIMRQDWKEGLKLQEALELTAKVLTKTMDSANPNAERLEFGIVERVSPTQVRFRMLSDAEVNKLMADAAPKESEGEAASSAPMQSS